MRPILLAALTLTAPLVAGTPEPVKVDVHGDPLSAGATERLGLARYRFPGAVFQFTADGKSVVAVSWGRYVSRLDAKTGRVTEQYTLPVEDARAAHLFPDGRRAIIVRRPRPDRWEDEREIWDLERKCRLASVGPGVEWIWQPAFSPDGQHLAVAWTQHDGTGVTLIVRLIDSRTGKVEEFDRSTFSPGGGVGIFAPVFSADGKQLAYGHWTQGAYQLSGRSISGSTPGWERTIESADMRGLLAAPDGRYLVLAGEKSVTLDASTGEPGERVEVPRGSWGPTGFTPAGDCLFQTSVETGNRLHVRDWKTGRSRSGADGWSVVCANGWVLVPSPNGSTALIGGADVRLIDLRTGKQVWGGSADDGHTASVTQLRFSGDGSRLASASEDGTVRVWDVATGRPVGRWEESGYSTGSPEWTGNNGWGYGVSVHVPMDLSPDGRLLVLVSSPVDFQKPVVARVVEADGGRQAAAHTLPLTRPAAGGEPEVPGAVAFSPAGDAVVLTYGVNSTENCVSPSHTTARWEFRTGRWDALGVGEPAPVERTAFGRSRPVRLTYGKVFDSRTGREAVELAGGGLGPLALSADDRLVAGVGRTVEDVRRAVARADIRDLRVWDARTGGVVAAFRWDPPPPQVRPSWLTGRFRPGDADAGLQWAWPRVMALSPTGRFLATVDLIGVRVWDAATGLVVQTIPAGPRPPIEHMHGRAAGAVAFTPDGSQLAVGMHDGTILFWPVPVSKPVPPKVDELPGVWADLLGADSVKGWRAAWRLMDDPAAAVKLVQAHLKPAERVAAADVARLLADTDSPEFRRREAATRRLTAIIDQVFPAVTEAEKAPASSPELRERLRKVLAAAPSDDRPLLTWAAAQSRAVAVLEHVRTSESLAAMRDLAGGAPGAWLTREAEAALARLGTRKP